MPAGLARGPVGDARRYGDGMAKLRLFASAREAAGTRDDAFDGATVGAVLDAAVAKYGADFAGVLSTAAVWCNGDPVERDHAVGPADEVAVLPPVSGGSGSPSPAR